MLLHRAGPHRTPPSACCWSSIAIVIGPTPPGTGVIARARAAADSKSTSPDEAVVGAVHADVDHGRARLDHVARDQARPARRRRPARPRCRHTAPRSRVREWQTVTVAFCGEQQRRRPACRPGRCARRPPPRAPSSGVSYARSSSITPDGVAGTSAVAALHEQARVGRRQPVDVLARVDRADVTRAASMWSGSGSCTMMPLTAGSAFSSRDQRRAARPRRCRPAGRGGSSAIPTSAQALCLPPT